jgi:hypothetical protein
MTRKHNEDKIRGRFTPIMHETAKSPAFKQLSFGARALFVALKMRCVKNNGHVYLSQRDAGEELDHKNRNNLANWYRELEHYGFIVKTEAASLGVNGRGKAAHWRITDMPSRSGGGEFKDPTKDFLKWDGTVFEPHVRPSRKWSPDKKAALKKQNPGRHVRTTVDDTSVPVVDDTSVPLPGSSGTNVTPIQANPTGTNVTPISRLATGVAGGSGRKEIGR